MYTENCKETPILIILTCKRFRFNSSQKWTASSKSQAFFKYE
jgi:hypothetical protein